MNTAATLTFPNLIELNEFNGNVEDYFSAVYTIFESHFIKSQPSFQGTRVSAQKIPLVDGIHRTFYHMTHEGNIENDRKPDFRRMERIRFPKFCIEACPNSNLLVWKNKRKRDDRILIFNEEEGYLIVLTERKGYNLLWTTYYIEYNHERRKKIKEYEAYIKAKTA